MKKRADGNQSPPLPPYPPSIHTTILGEGGLAELYTSVRRLSEALCEPLQTEDYVIQSMPDASPAKWHLAHTTWFFETLVLKRFHPEYRPIHPGYEYIFNSYYNSVGAQHPRVDRGKLSRPTVKEIFEYRAHVDEHMCALLDEIASDPAHEALDLIDVGLSHEQQHQELTLTDIKHVFSVNPLHPPYRARAVPEPAAVPPLRWIEHPSGLQWIGHREDGFCYDNERPRHRVYIEAGCLGDRLITNGEYMRFIEAGGYRSPQWWLSDGWQTVGERGWTAPLYWQCRDGEWSYYTLSGPRPVDPAEPVCHVSYYEADAYARWAGASLPTEADWESAASNERIEGNFLEGELFHPRPAEVAGDRRTRQMFGDVWEWTSSPYVAYPGFEPAPGTVGEYNGKFMCNRMVLRGGSCATPRSHIRPTYRNFFPPDARWQFSGFRLARRTPA